MDYSRNIINDNSDIYLGYDYLMYPVNLSIVPKIVFRGDAFFSKTNYHVSLMCLEGVPKKDQVKILKFAQKYTLRPGKITKTFRLAIKADKKAIIVRIRFYGLKKLIFGINKNFDYHFEYPPTHVTLFTLKGQTGIGINTFKKYRQISSQISPSDSLQLKKSFKII